MKLNLAEILSDLQKVYAKPKTVGRIAKEIQLQKLGFKKLGDKLTSDNKLSKLAEYKYVKITEEKIKAFIDRKAVEYDKNITSTGLIKNSNTENNESNWRYTYIASPVSYINSYDDDVISNESFLYSANTVHYTSGDKGTIGKFEWEEKPIKEIEELPPNDVLIKLAEHKQRNVFDYFTIAKVKNMYDPLLFGRIEGSTDRYFIAQWGDDINLDDVI